MRLLVQRVLGASVDVDGACIAEIGEGLLVFTGFKKGDNADLLPPMARKLLGLRAFSDTEGKMNLNLAQKRGELLLVSQFTLYADTKHGLRPGFDPCLDAQSAAELYQNWVDYLKSQYARVLSGIFQAKMRVSLVNDGPVTLLLDTDEN